MSAVAASGKRCGRPCPAPYRRRNSASCWRKNSSTFRANSGNPAGHLDEPVPHERYTLPVKQGRAGGFRVALQLRSASIVVGTDDFPVRACDQSRQDVDFHAPAQQLDMAVGEEDVGAAGMEAV